jgi:polysaccharide export outer membrane protein
MSRLRWHLMVLVVALLLVPPSASRAQVSDKAYIIGPEDVLEVQVWERRDLNQTVFVRPDGRTSLPLVGEIMVAGKTVQELQDHLAKVYDKTSQNAVVTVIVKEIKSRPVYFVGGFGRPGPLQLTRELSLMQAISIIGGVVPGGDAEKGYLLRGDKRVAIDFYKLLQKGDLTQNTQLEPGDTVVVPIADMVFVQGEVRAPSPIKYTNDLTVLKAITQAGGLTPLAAAGRVDLLRGKTGEKKERIRIDVDKIMKSPEENPDVGLKPEDIIYVPQRLF